MQYSQYSNSLILPASRCNRGLPWLEPDQESSNPIRIRVKLAIFRAMRTGPLLSVLPLGGGIVVGHHSCNHHWLPPSHCRPGVIPSKKAILRWADISWACVSWACTSWACTCQTRYRLVRSYYSAGMTIAEEESPTQLVPGLPASLGKTSCI
jgi:hypothetical protein